MSEIELVDSQLNILLNLCYLRDKRDFSVHSPLLDANIFDVELKRSNWRCEPATGLETFKNKVEEARSRVPDHLRDEIPGTDPLRTVLIAAGAFDLEHFGEDFLSTIRKMKGNIGKYSLCFDTNVLYKRFVSSTLAAALEEEGLSESMEMIMSNMVSSEVREKYNRRYKKGEVGELADVGGEVFQDFNKQYKLVSRKAKMAHTEMDHIDRKMQSIFHGEEDYIDNNEKRDLRIIKEYEDSKRETKKKPILLGFEKDFPEKVKEFDLDFVLLEQPDPSQASIDHQNLYLLLRYTAQIFGYVKLRGLGCGLQGIWKGMQDDEFNDGKVKAAFDEHGDVSNELQEAVKVSSAVRKAMG
ncbi:MAG: hypothetical protein ACOC87_04430 [Candidatus Natronoplasma sp.]